MVKGEQIMNILRIMALIFVTTISNIAQNIEIILTLEKNNYLECEPIYILAELKNSSSEAIRISSFVSGIGSTSFKAILKNSKGQIIPSLNQYPGEIYSRRRIITIQPGESAYSPLQILGVFANNSLDDEGISRDNAFLINGDYSIQLQYNCTLFDTKNKRKKETVYLSNVEAFRITKPYIKEDLISYREISNALAIKTARNFDKYVQKLIDIIENYPTNAYTLLAHDYLSSMSNVVRGINYDKYKKKFIMDFPNRIKAAYIGRDVIVREPSFKEKIKSKELKERIEKLEKYYKSLKKLGDK